MSDCKGRLREGGPYATYVGAVVDRSLSIFAANRFVERSFSARSSTRPAQPADSLSLRLRESWSASAGVDDEDAWLTPVYNLSGRRQLSAEITPGIPARQTQPPHRRRYAARHKLLLVLFAHTDSDHTSRDDSR